jgi:hypothetical protein
VASLRLFLMKRNITRATKACAIIAPIIIPVIAPPDNLFEDEADVFDVDGEEMLVGEMIRVTTEPAGVETVETMDAVPVVTTEGCVVVDRGASVVLTATFVLDEGSSEPNAMSCDAVNEVGVSVVEQPEIKSPTVTLRSSSPQFW